MAAKYSRLATEDPELGDSVAFDFSSTHRYATPSHNYKSIFTYSNSDMQMKRDGISYTVGKMTS